MAAASLVTIAVASGTANGSVAPQQAPRAAAAPTAGSRDGTGFPGAGSAHGRVPVCRTGNLRASIGNGEGAAGHTYETIRLTNSGKTSCAIRGFPGVSYVGARGRQLGAAADRTGGAGRRIVLRPGEYAASTLAIVHPGIQAGCDKPAQIVPAAYLRVYPPANRQALFLRTAKGEDACANPAVHQLTVTVLTK
jgi:hypothetical protein